MKIAAYLNRPEYILRPTQLYHRFAYSQIKAAGIFRNFLLPWGMEITVSLDPSDVVGRSIGTQGIYDLSLTEVLWRLISPGEQVVDVGANVGYITSIMAHRAGRTGKVWCFEPNPDTYFELSKNVNHWKSTYDWEHICPQQLALSNCTGVGLLGIPKTNQAGEAFLMQAESSSHSSKDVCRSYEVALIKLDDFLEEGQQIDVIKIDVEGHELDVLRGAINLIRKQQIRDIVFEEHYGYPSLVTQFLEDYGYTIFKIQKGFWKPKLSPPTKNTAHPWEPPNYLATLNADRAIEKLHNWGYYSLSGV